MKLLAKTGLIYFLSTTLVFLIGGVVFYYNLSNIVDEETTEHIYLEKTKIEKYVKLHDTVPTINAIGGDFISIYPSNLPTKQLLRDTLIFDEEEGEYLSYRKLTFPILAGKQHYSVCVSKSLFESDDLVETILFSFIIITLVLLVSTLVFNGIISKKLLKPFFNTVKQLNEYQIDQQIPLQFSPTSTSEFKKLNAALSKMTEKIAADYKNLKTFTENASHELQTPLSVIMASTELLLQQENLSEKQLEAIQGIHQTARKLSKLNQTLLLLAKIENRQFEERRLINLPELLEKKLEHYADFITHKELKVESHFHEKVFLKIHPVLADILISNIISNAIRHNIQGGKIEIMLSKNQLVVANSGGPIKAPDRLFERFYHENTSSDSTGLGLAIIKQIAETNHMDLKYECQNLHSFILHFHPESIQN